MSLASRVEIVLSSAFDGKGFKLADTATQKLNKNVKTLGKTLGYSMGAAGLAGYAKSAVKAFAADDKAAQILTRSLQNLGLGFHSVQVSSFIAEMEKTYGVLDDQLRPAFQSLLTQTGSVADAQSMLKTALSLSAASGADLTSVSSDLAKAYVGQTKGLTKYYLGLSQTELKAMSFEQIQKRINTLFAGQAQLAVNSYSGQIDKLTVAAANAKETIGKGLVDALISLNAGGAGGINKSTENMQKLADAFAKGIVYGTRFSKLVYDLTLGTNRLKTALGDVKSWFDKDPFAAYGGGSVESIRANAMAQFYATKKIEDARKKSILAAAAAAKKLAAAETKAKKDILTLSKQGAIFELDKIQIVAALQGKISTEERTRLELQMALLTGNADEATRLTNKLAETTGMSKELSNWLKSLPDAKNPFEAWQTYLDAIEKSVRRIASMGTGGGAGTPTIMGTGAFAGLDMTPVGEAGIPQFQVDRLLNGRDGGGGNAPIIVNVQIAGEDVNAIVTTGLQNQSLSGIPSYIDRKLGGW